MSGKDGVAPNPPVVFPRADPKVPLSVQRVDEIAAAVVKVRQVFGQGSLDKNALFRGADLRGADLSGMDLTGCDLSGADLREANLARCILSGSLRGADLWNADLSDSDLSGAKDLFPADLAACDLTGAKLPPDWGEFEGLKSVEGLSQNSSAVFLTLLGAAAYAILTLAATRDVVLISDTDTIQLPVLGVSVSIVSFYVLMPLILVMFFVYFHIYLLRLWEAMAKLPAIFVDGRRLDEQTYPWLMNDLVRTHLPRLAGENAPPLSLLQAVLSIASGYWLIPIVLGVTWLKFLRAENWLITLEHVLLLGVACGASTYFSRLLMMTLAKKAVHPSWVSQFTRAAGAGLGIPGALLTIAITLYVSYGAIEADIINDHPSAGDRPLQNINFRPDPRRSAVVWRDLRLPGIGAGVESVCAALHFGVAPDVVDADVSVKPPSWTGLRERHNAELAMVHGAEFRNRSLRHLQANRAFLANATFQRVDLRLAVFDGADLRTASISYCAADRASFLHASFAEVPSYDAASQVETDPAHHAATFKRNSLVCAKFSKAQLSYVENEENDLEDAAFDGAICFYSDFRNCRLVGTNFSAAHCDGAVFEEKTVAPGDSSLCAMQKANFADSTCSSATFSKCDLAGASFRKALLYRASFSETNLTGVDLTEAWLQEADLESASGLTVEQLSKAGSLFRAILPEELMKDPGLQQRVAHESPPTAAPAP